MRFIAKLVIAAVALALCLPSLRAASLEIPAIQVVPIKDSATEREYELYVKLPDDYDAEDAKSHPVIYIMDALWHVEIISGSIEYLVEDAILVGISWEKGLPPQLSRMRDYMANEYDGEGFDHPTGKADEHLAFIRDDVIEYVESEYKADSSRRTLYGYSVSGTFASYVLLTQPDLFKNYIIGSPATLFGDHFAHEYEPIATAIPKSLDANIFISVGSDEEAANIGNAISLVSFLKTKKTERSDVRFRIIESADHGQAFPISAVESLYWLAELPE
ncbi:MAG: alpha/beta hydrolase-fold protein [Pseudomonadota bacterium]